MGKLSFSLISWNEKKNLSHTNHIVVTIKEKQQKKKKKKDRNKSYKKCKELNWINYFLLLSEFCSEYFC